MWLSLLPPFWLCPMLRTSTEITLSSRSKPAGISKVPAEFWLPLAVPVLTVPRLVPFSHTVHTPARPVPAVSEICFPAPVKCPRYQTSP